MTQFLCSAITVLSIVMSPAIAAEPTWVEIGSTVYGAKPDERGPIGGSGGYANIVAKGDYTVSDIDGLLDALSKAKAGQVVFIPEETEIDLTARIHIDRLMLEIPEGVTLAGDRGHQGSQGAMLMSDVLDTPAMIRAAGPDVRITGLRIQGPHAGRDLDHHRRSFQGGGSGSRYYYKFPNSDGIQTRHPRLEVDNCEISAFTHAAVTLSKGDGHHIHHNFIHHCQHAGLGYGVSLDTAASVIEHNLFDFTRHSIAGTGRPGCSYIARHNVHLSEAIGNIFDMHGGVDRKDGTDIAGTSIEIHNNTFRSPYAPAVLIRGVPEEGGTVCRNWFPRHRDSAQAVQSVSKTSRTRLTGTKMINIKAFDNAYGEKPQVDP